MKGAAVRLPAKHLGVPRQLPLSLVLPSQHTIFLVGLITAAVVIASALVTTRDVWLSGLRAHRHAVRRALLAAVLVVIVAVAIGHLNDLTDLLRRVKAGDPWWLAAAVGLEVVSFGGYVVLTHLVHSPRAPKLDWIASTELTLGGVVATRVLSTGGAGGIAFTGWVLHRAGMSPRVAARRLTAFMIILYSFYVAALLLGGVLVVSGLLDGVPRLLGLIALFVGGLVTGVAFAILRIPHDLERRAEAMARGSGPLRRLIARLAPVPQVAGAAARLAISIVQERRSVLAWPAVWWSFDIAALWASFHAFGDAPPTGTLVLCYFLGQMGNLLPLPGGVGGTEGGMVGAFAACGVNAGLALVAVVGYRVMSTYLPGIPGLGSYLDLRRRMRGWAAAERADYT
jgi:uncharacterized membrane protein YbhN (UPF0104 family)